MEGPTARLAGSTPGQIPLEIEMIAEFDDDGI
jgi:hypothetical protein